MDLVKLFASADPRGAQLVNLLLCLLGALWLVGVEPSRRDRDEWVAWLGFWLGTAVYYATAAFAVTHVDASTRCNAGFALCSLAGCTHPITKLGYVSRLGVPFEQMGLYIATGLLLWVNQGSRRRRASRGWMYPILLVIAAIGADFWLACHFDTEHTGAHQLVTALALGASAWRLRIRDQSKSATILLYALTQLPIQPLMRLLEIDRSDYSDFVASTLILYAALKLTVIPIATLIASIDDEDDRPLAQASAAREPTDTTG